MKGNTTSPSLRSIRKVETVCRDFEQQRVCYLPFNIFLLRPLHRLLHYKLILERLCKHYPPTHDDFRDCRGTALPFSFSFHPHLSSLVCIFIYSHLFIFLSAALADISEMVVQLQGTMMKMENFQKLLELKKDLTGIDILAIPGRVGLQISSHFVNLSLSAFCPTLGHMFLFNLQEFIRLGCLSKLSGKGLQQRMFFLVRQFGYFSKTKLISAIAQK